MDTNAKTENHERVWGLSKESYGPLWPYIINKDITDIEWDGRALWVKDVDSRSKRLNNVIDKEFVQNFCSLVANHENKPFSKLEYILEAETESLRITCVHESFATTGTCFCIRKSLPELRFSAAEAIDIGYCEEETMHLLVNCIEAGLVFAIAGNPGDGKTELSKFLSSFIDEEENVIVIEDSREMHYADINPNSKCIQLNVDSHEDYEKALKVALRLDPQWILLTEARSREMYYVIEGWSTGVKGITSLHADDVRNIPDRAATMAGDVQKLTETQNTVYTYLNVGILMKREKDEKGNKIRKIKQMCFYHREDNENKCYMVVKNGLLNKEELPEYVVEKMLDVGIKNPFYSERLQEHMRYHR